jgi:hypothetical protein
MTIFLLLRIVRAIFGMAGIGYALVGCSTINNASELGLEAGIARMGIAFVCLLIFGALRWVTNTLHTRQHGVPHPALSKDWSL